LAGSAGRTPPLALLLGAFLVLGLPGGSFGVAWPSIRAEFGLPLSALGAVIVATGAGYIASSAGSGWIATQFHTRRLVALAAALLAAGIGGFAISPSWWLCVAAATIAGSGGGVLDAGLTAHVALHRGLRSMNALHAAWGVGSTLGTLLVTAAVAATSWRVAYAVMAAFFFVLAVVFVVLPAEGAARTPEASRSPRLGLGVLLALALFFVYTGLEQIAGAWSFSFFTVDSMPTVTAGVLVSAYWAAFTAGRALLALLGGRLGARLLLDVSVAVAAAGALLMVAGVAVALPVIGVGLAAIYPALMNLTPIRLGREVAVHAVGYQTASGNLGATVLPALCGVILQARGVTLLPALLLATTLVLVALHIAAARGSA
jgi:fucose permease